MNTDTELKQASAPMTIPMGQELFEDRKDTIVVWLGSGGIFINSRGTKIMIDPVLEPDPENPELSEAGFPLLVPVPIRCQDIRALDAVLYTHADYDHMAPETCRGLLHTGAVFRGTSFTCLRLREDFGIEKSCLEPMDSGTEESRLQPMDSGMEESRLQPMEFGTETVIGSLRIRLTPCTHNWRHNRPEFTWEYGPEDCCGFYIETPDGSIWVPGDSTRMEEHFRQKEPDLMFWDISADPFHFGTETALELAAHYRNSCLMLYHYGTYDAPAKPAFSADPSWVRNCMVNPGRLRETAPGEPVFLPLGKEKQR